MKKRATVKRRTAIKKRKIVKPMTIDHTHTQGSLTDVMRIVAVKADWLTTIDKRELSKKYGMAVSAVMRQVRGGIKKPSYDLLCDALDMIRVNEAKLLTRITNGSTTIH